VVPEVLHLSSAELALMCVLMLRGPQTPGELRGNGARLYEFSGLDEVEQTLNALISRDPDPLVVRLPRQAGQKEVRFAQLLSGEVQVETIAEAPRVSPRESLEQKVDMLAAEIESLRQQFEQFKKQFD
jgi:uncharacterized protein YceH (UPF0502 family)